MDPGVLLSVANQVQVNRLPRDLQSGIVTDQRAYQL